MTRSYSVAVFFRIGANALALAVGAGAVSTSCHAGDCVVGIIETVVGGGIGDGGPATEAALYGPASIAFGLDDSMYIAESGGHRVRKVDRAGMITTVAGTGKGDYPGDGKRAVEASLWAPHGIAVGADGSLYAADTDGHRIRRIDIAGTITTIAGNGQQGYSGDGGPAVDASLNRPTSVAVSADGSLYIADFGNCQVYRVWWRPGDPDVAKAKADDLGAKADDSPRPWREVAELYVIAKAWDHALAAAERALALTPETDEPARMSAEMLVARVYIAKRDDHEARRRLIRVLARATDPMVLREAADALVELYLRRGERDQALATLDDLRLRTQDRTLIKWIDQRLKEIAGE